MILYICNSYRDLEKLSYSETVPQVVYNSNELSIIDYSKIKYIVVLSELTWDLNRNELSPSQHNGLTIIRYFRLILKLKIPVLIISKYPDSELLRDPKNMIINAVGHRYKKFNPFKSFDIEKELLSSYFPPLNDMQLIDLIYNYCNAKGQVGEIIHKLKGEIAEILNGNGLKEKKNRQSISVLQKGLNDVSKIIPNSDSSRSLMQNIVNEFKTTIENNYSLAEIFLQKHEENLFSLVEETELTPVPKRIHHNWKVLFLDDERDSINPINKTLEENGVSVILCSHVDEAQKIIEEDEKIQDDHTVNSITVVISDYRLLEPGTKIHQPRQGYDFIFDTAKRDRLTSFVALSGLGRQFLLESFRKYNLRVEVYSKDDLRSSERNRQIFAENIIQLGDSQYDAVCSQSTSKGWNNDGKKRFYIEHRQRQDYFETEKLLSDDARRYINHFTYMHQKGALIGHKPISDLQTSLENKIFTPENIDIFRKILYARRLVFWLYHIVGLDSDAIYLLLSTGEILNLQNRIEPEVVGNNAKQLMGRLCIKLTDYPKGFLIEEKSWFKYQMDVDIDDLREVILQLQVHCNLILSKYPLFKKEMLGWKILQSSIEKNTLIIASVGDVKRIIRAIKENVKDGDTAAIAYKMIEEMITSMISDVAGEEHMFDVIKIGRECLAILKRRKS